MLMHAFLKPYKYSQIAFQKWRRVLLITTVHVCQLRACIHLHELAKSFHAFQYSHAVVQWQNKEEYSVCIQFLFLELDFLNIAS